MSKRKDDNKELGVWQKAIQYAASAFRVGNSEQEIATTIDQTFPHLGEANVQLAILKGSQLIADQYSRDRKNVVAVHVKRYDEDIQKLINPENDCVLSEDGEDNEGMMDGAKRRKQRINALLMCLEVMFSKERVLQIHEKSTQVKIFNKLNAKVKEKKVSFNLANLTLEEKVEFLSLIEKSKKTENELFSVKTVDRVQEVTEDVEHEVVDTPSVALIPQVNVEKPVVKVKVQKNVTDITNKLQNALKRKALIEIKKKGGYKGGPHIIDHTE